MNNKNWHTSYLLLNSKVALKRLEQPFVYHILRDELYELDDRAIKFLSQCNGTKKGDELTDESDFVEYCLDEQILLALPELSEENVFIEASPCPSLRYLELQLTRQCNLKCRHCYLGPAKKEMLHLDDAIKISREFASMGGLRLMISGGEPMLYADLNTFLNQISDLKVRKILLTNGTLITKRNLKELHVDEIQFSLDGWRKGHESLRGPGTFDQVIEGIQYAKDAGIQVSIATMVHKENLTEFERLERFAEDMEICEWGVDMLCEAGNLKNNEVLTVSPETAAAYMKYAFGGGYHGNSDGYACGRHLMTVLPTGVGVKCGFYEDKPLADARNSLSNCWRKLKHTPLKDLICHKCPSVEDCAGGCRFRAPHPLAADPVMCALHDVDSSSF